MERLGYVHNPRSLMEGTETLCPHATILNHRWLPGTRSRLLSVKPNEWMHLSPFYTHMHGEWLRYAKSTSQFHWLFSLVRDDRGFQVNPLCPPSGNGGYVRNLDVLTACLHKGSNWNIKKDFKDFIRIFKVFILMIRAYTS